MDYITALNENLTNNTCCLSQTKLITFPNTHTNTHSNPLTNTNYPKSHYNQNKHSTLTYKFTAQNLKTTNRALPLEQETNYHLKSIFQPQKNCQTTLQKNPLMLF